ncbi:MAG TPA: transglutaminase-like domain-containing protein [bacterium]|nr:transglutaminase-like domain-containing protein [bacterium]
MDLPSLASHDIETIPLEEIAFALVREKYPDFDASLYRARIDEFARRADQRVNGVLGAYSIIQSLGHYLFDEEGFRGNTGDYYNPANSFLNDVLDTRQGIPITLSILYIAIGRRIGLNVRGVSFPGHFLVRYESEDGVLFIDPYHKGKILTETECRERLQEMYGNDLPYHNAFLEPAGHREVLLRMLTNLKLIAFMQRDYPMALQLLNRILLFKPEGPFELKERGLVEYQLECFAPALKDLETYLNRQPDDPDRPDLENYLQDLRSKVDRMA